MIKHKPQKSYINQSKIRNLNKITLAIFYTFLLSFCVFSQTSKDQSDFTGTWILDEEASFNSKEQRERFGDYTVKFEDRGDSVELNKSYILEGKLYREMITLNMKKIGETNFNVTTDQEIRSVSYRKKNKIYREFLQTIRVKKVDVKYKVVEKYKISKKKNKITIETNRKVISTSDLRLSEALGGLFVLDYKTKKILRLKE